MSLSECPGEGDLGGEVETRHLVPSPPLLRDNNFSDPFQNVNGIHAVKLCKELAIRGSNSLFASDSGSPTGAIPVGAKVAVEL